ncbi:penicillin-binding protein 1A [Pseudocolwellia sp. AS88]|uniref:penicillin-binding protein 1A n=1 Tax=Pseudocolwellia sp. AS88 TaxID=3063958 RepID=UPI0026ECDCC2|nr:penicillin-binding protein 1A [Pseudocolwellia sp. AS88]MDO7084027.1 penicillin-binding protein 1A [Pseudocolwellia sp. AS88]
MFTFKNLLKVFFILFILGSISLAALYFSMRSELPSVNILKEIQWQTPMQIFSADGKLISQFGEKKRIPVTLDEVPQHLINALLATEDDRFYYHFGVDPIGMSRAILGQLTGQNKGGASTITMQVARNFFLSSEITYTRKIREIFLAFHIESLLTKDEILTLYLNKIPLGHRSFGFAAAAQVYYGKELNDLSLAQIAVLAGLPKAPSAINPIRSPSKAKARRSVVLRRMLDTNYITNEEYAEAMREPITGEKHGTEIQLSAPYLAEMAHQEVLDIFGKEAAYSEGYKIYTTVQSHLQIAAQQAVITNLHAYDQRHGYRGPLLSLRPQLKENFQDENPIITNTELLTESEITQAFEQITTYQSLLAAVVIEVLDNSIKVRLEDNSIVTIDWDGLSWARKYITDSRQGTAPDYAYQILTYGDVILIDKKDDLYRLSQLPLASSALISLSPDDGAIEAIVGGYSFQQSQFNRVTQAKRQVGSNIKPFLYSAALEHGFTLASLVNDAPINQWDESSGSVWRPKNSPAKYDGPIRVRLALAQSKNVVAVRLFRQVGKTNVINHLQSFGFKRDEIPRNETLALGSASFTPLEIATGYAVFANGGFLIEPYFIDRIEDSNGNVVFKANPKIACDEICIQQKLAESLEPVNTESNAQDVVVEFISNNDEISDDPELTETELINSELTTSAQASDDSGIESKTTNKSITTDNNLIELNIAERVLNPQNAFLITNAMNSVIWGADWNKKPYWQGTGWRSRALKRKDLSGKTGTTNQSKDAWFSGFSRRLVTSTWIGFDDPSKDLGRTSYNNNLPKNQITGSEAGANSAQPAWNLYMKEALPYFPYEAFTQPNDVVSARIDKATGKLSHKTDRSSDFEYFKKGTIPTESIPKNDTYNLNEGDNSSIDGIF